MQAMKLKDTPQTNPLNAQPSQRSRSRERASWMERRHKKARGLSPSLFTWRY